MFNSASYYFRSENGEDQEKTSVFAASAEGLSLGDVPVVRAPRQRRKSRKMALGRPQSPARALTPVV